MCEVMCAPVSPSVQSTKPDSSVDEVEEELDDETKRRDQLVKGAIEGLIREYSSELNAPSQEADTHHRKKKKEKKEDVRCSYSHLSIYWLKMIKVFMIK